jgi:hypothetical protein
MVNFRIDNFTNNDKILYIILPTMKKFFHYFSLPTMVKFSLYNFTDNDKIFIFFLVYQL